MRPVFRPTDQPTMPGRRTVLSGALVLLASGRSAFAQDSVGGRPRLDVPYVPTPQDVVEAMLEMASVKRSDVVYDLGCGDGRIVITAAKQHGARGLGIDIDPVRIKEARQNAEIAGVSDQVQFQVGDLFRANFSPATVVTLYLLPDLNRKLRPQLWRQLNVGARVVSHAFDMGPQWPPERTEYVGSSRIYFWTIRPEHKRT
jgi:SAM-dependent methyltransferase